MVVEELDRESNPCTAGITVTAPEERNSLPYLLYTGPTAVKRLGFRGFVQESIIGAAAKLKMFIDFKRKREREVDPVTQSWTHVESFYYLNVILLSAVISISSMFSKVFDKCLGSPVVLPREGINNNLYSPKQEGSPLQGSSIKRSASLPEFSLSGDPDSSLRKDSSAANLLQSRHSMITEPRDKVERDYEMRFLPEGFSPRIPYSAHPTDNPHMARQEAVPSSLLCLSPIKRFENSGYIWSFVE